MFYRPRHYQVYVQAVLIGLAFTIRYTAIYYPIISIFAFLFFKYKFLLKFIGIISPWILVVPFIIYTQQKTKKATGTAEFSVFGGWQLANNALYMYDHIKIDSSKLPPRTVELNRMARKYFEQIPPEYRQLDPLPGTFFIKVPNAILKPYLRRKNLKITDAPSEFLAWGTVSPVYKEYGEYLIKHYPVAFAQYYLWLNTKNYFIPHLEKFGNYNLDMDTVYDPAVKWFKLKGNSISAIPSQEFQNHLFFFYPPFFMMLNLYFSVCLIYLLSTRRLFKIKRPLFLSILFTTAFLFINFCFSIFATPVVLRYQVVPMIILFTFSLYLTDMLDRGRSIEKNLARN